MLGTPILHLDGRWQRLDDGVAADIEGPEHVAGPRWVLTDFDGDGQAGIETTVGPASHAPALIEKRLRTRGALDGHGRVLVHRRRSSGGTTNVLYSAIPADVYSRLHERAARQSDHCLLVPLAAVLARRVSLDGGDRALVCRHGRVLDLLVAHDGEIEAVAQSTAFSTEPDDMRRAILNLASEVEKLGRERGVRPEAATWYDLDPVADVDLADAFEQAVGLKVERHGGADARERLLAAARPSDTIGSGPARASYRLEAIMPLAAAAMVTLCLALLGADWWWSRQASDLDRRHDARSAQADREELRRNIAALDAKGGEQARVADEFVRFISLLDAARQAPDIRKILTDVKAASPQGVRILGIKLTHERDQPVIAVDGTSDKPLPIVVRDLERFGAALKGRGYSVDQRGSGVMDQDNIFRIVLRVENTTDA